MQGAAGPDHRQGAHHRVEHRIVPFPADNGEEEARVEINAGAGGPTTTGSNEGEYEQSGGPNGVQKVGHA